MRPIAINLHAKRGMETEAYIGKAREVGFNALMSEALPLEELEKIAKLLLQQGMSYEMIHAPFRHVNDIWRDDESGERMLAEMINAVQGAAAVGCPTVVVHLTAGKILPRITDLGGARYEILVEYAACKGVKIAFENQRSFSHLAWALERFEKAPNVGFCWDCGHEGCFTQGREFMPVFGDKLICTHLHDNNGILNDDQHKIPFDGSLDMSRVARQLRQGKYSGTLTLELFAENTNFYDRMTVFAFLEKAAMAAKRLRLMVDGF
ncbi:MAG: sugar phosphate isomerase/epimerase [Clostridia bacterium]|nr:sugar phosphate isomerase/epimerase [Clostridia bacterium]